MGLLNPNTQTFLNTYLEILEEFRKAWYDYYQIDP